MDYGLELIMYRYWLIHFSKCTTLMFDVNKKMPAYMETLYYHLHASVTLNCCKT